MKEYRHYMIMEICKDNEDWMIAELQDYQKAKDFTEAYISKTGERIEIWGTDEAPDTFKSCSTLYIRNLTYGTSINYAEMTDTERQEAINLTSFASKVYDAEGGDGGADSLNEIVTQLKSLKGCYNIIEYLLSTIDSILE